MRQFAIKKSVLFDREELLFLGKEPRFSCIKISWELDFFCILF